MRELLENVVEDYLILISVGATSSELDEPLKRVANALKERQRTIDLEQVMLDTLYEAADESSWILKEHYFMNDWISDCARFLRTGKGINDD